MGQAKRRGTFEQRKAQAVEHQRKADESITLRTRFPRIKGRVRFHESIAALAVLSLGTNLWK